MIVLDESVLLDGGEAFHAEFPGEISLTFVVSFLDISLNVLSMSPVWKPTFSRQFFTCQTPTPWQALQVIATTFAYPESHWIDSRLTTLRVFGLAAGTAVSCS